MLETPKTKAAECWELALGGSFVIQEGTLHIEAAGKAGQGSIGAYESMAGDDDRDRIGSVGAADGAHRFRTSDVFSDLTIGAGLAGWDGQQSLPDLLLKGGTTGSEIELEFPASTSIVGIELTPNLIRRRILLSYDHLPMFLEGELEVVVELIEKADAMQMPGVVDQQG